MHDQQIKTLLEQPLFAVALINLHTAKRITYDLLVEAMASPELARKIVTHEAMHDYFKTTTKGETK